MCNQLFLFRNISTIIPIINNTLFNKINQSVIVELFILYFWLSTFLHSNLFAIIYRCYGNISCILLFRQSIQIPAQGCNTIFSEPVYVLFVDLSSIDYIPLLEYQHIPLQVLVLEPILLHACSSAEAPNGKFLPEP